jgi:hypothetical protein
MNRNLNNLKNNLKNIDLKHIMTKKSKSKKSSKTTKRARKASLKTTVNGRKPNRYPKDRKKGTNKWFQFLNGKTPESAKIRNRLISDHSRTCKELGVDFDRFKFNSQLASLMAIEYRKQQDEN